MTSRVWVCFQVSYHYEDQQYDTTPTARSRTTCGAPPDFHQRFDSHTYPALMLTDFATDYIQVRCHALTVFHTHPILEANCSSSVSLTQRENCMDELMTPSLITHCLPVWQQRHLQFKVNTPITSSTENQDLTSCS